MNIPLGEWSGSNATKKLERTLKSGEKKKFILDLIMIIVAFSALAVSFRSCQISEDANKTSEDAIEISKQSNKLSEQAIETNTGQFFKENKPYIILKPRKIKELQSYYKYILLPDQNAVKIELQYEIKNIGRVAAKDLAIFNKIQVGKSSNRAEIRGLDIPNKITLGPGENYILGIVSLIGWDKKESYDRFVKKLSSEKGPEVTIQMGVTYLSELNPKQSYSSTVANKINKERAKIIKIEYEEE